MRSKPLCVLVDDEESSLAFLKSKIEELGMLEIEKAYLDPDLFLTQIQSLKSEIIFLDIEMPISGMKIAEGLKHKKVIFVSGQVNQAIKAFDVAAVDFVEKPIRASRLQLAIEKAVKLLPPRILSLKTENASREEIPIASIVLIVPHKEELRDKIIKLNDGTTIRAKNCDLKDLEMELPKEKFLKLNRSELVNLDYVTKLIDRDTVGVRIGNIDVPCTLAESSKSAFFAMKPHLKS